MIIDKQVKIVCDGTYSNAGNGIFLSDGTAIPHVREIHFNLVPDGVAEVDLTIFAPSAELNAIVKNLDLRGLEYFKINLNLFLFKLGRWLRGRLE